MKTLNSLAVAAVAGVIANSPTQVEAGELTGSISADLNSHFVSYGTDVWAGGTDLTEAPSLFVAAAFDYAINDAVTFSTGFWLDVNDNPSGSDFQTQETDTWFGISYASGITTYSVTYQNWQYGDSDTEEVLDVAVAFDTFLSPSITYHKRLAATGSQSLGSMVVVAGSYDYDICEKWSLSVPVAVGIATEELNGDDTGFGYASIGLQNSYSLSDKTSLNFGLTYYFTDEEVTGNSDEDFLTANLGVAYSF